MEAIGTRLYRRSVCLFITTVNPAKMADSFEMPFKVINWVGPSNYILDGGFRSPMERADLGICLSH